MNVVCINAACQCLYAIIIFCVHIFQTREITFRAPASAPRLSSRSGPGRPPPASLHLSLWLNSIRTRVSIRTGVGRRSPGQSPCHQPPYPIDRDSDRGRGGGTIKWEGERERNKSEDGVRSEKDGRKAAVSCDGGPTGHVSDHAFVLQLGLGGLGLQTRGLQQEALWFGGAGESRPQRTHTRLFVFRRR